MVFQLDLLKEKRPFLTMIGQIVDTDGRSYQQPQKQKNHPDFSRWWFYKFVLPFKYLQN